MTDSMTPPVFHRLARPGLPDLAYEHISGQGPLIVWLCGFRSDMGGTKAEHLAQAARRRGAHFLRFDYRGCGRSEGEFIQAGIGPWLADTLDMIDSASRGPVVLVGSSMGGWLALLAARARSERVKAMTLIAPAPDFTARLMWPDLPEEARNAIDQQGVWLQPSAYGEGPYPISKFLIQDGENHLLLHAPIAFGGPVRILHGLADPDVPWGLTLELAERLTSEDVEITFVKNGDHRLSSRPNLKLLEDTVFAMAEAISALPPRP
ncbi:MAG: alpha/beta hydrolase [Caulobacterales bacterium]|jgi:pimeloyl-ACP methyl ester carboxylesterase